MKKRASKSCLLLLVVAVSAACGEEESQSNSVPSDLSVDGRDDGRLVALGRALFFDRRISETGRHACVTCHDLTFSGEDNHAFSITPQGARSHHAVPTVWNSGALPALFWTGAARTLEEQAEGPLAEMGLGDPESVVARVRAVPGYAAEFAALYPKAGVTLDNMTHALASFERTLVTTHSPYDRFLGGQRDAISVEAARGAARFDELGCTSCHAGKTLGPTLAKPFAVFPRVATSPYAARHALSDDQGRQAVTGEESDAHVFRIAPLREVARTAPYFHNGSVTTLDEAVRTMASTQLDIELRDDDTRAIVAFLRSVSGDLPAVSLPSLPTLPDDFPPWREGATTTPP
jgi:cytochrome c peroxidase